MSKQMEISYPPLNKNDKSKDLENFANRDLLSKYLLSLKNNKKSTDSTTDVQYVELNQQDLELDSNKETSSSDDDLFQRKVRRKFPIKKKILHRRNFIQMNSSISDTKNRRLRFYLSALLGAIILALLIAAFYFIYKSNSQNSENQKVADSSIHLEDILTGRFVERRFNGSWSNESHVIFKENNSIIEFNIKSKKQTIIFIDSKQEYALFEKSADGKYLLLAKNLRKNFRHSFQADYDILDISSGKIHPILFNGEQNSLFMVQWAPVGNGMVINFERNLYYKPSALSEEVAITDDKDPAVINGIPDWVYEEEVFSSNFATWFNPNGKFISFIRFDDSQTHVMNFPYYGEAGDLRYQYPFNRLIAYPKAGALNPRVTLYTSDLQRAIAGKDHLTKIPVPSALNTEADQIIVQVIWLNNDNVLSTWMNRIQNQAYFQVFDVVKLNRFVNYNIESKTGWLDLSYTPLKNKDGSRIAVILPQMQDNGVYYRHLCLLFVKENNNRLDVLALTKGKFVVQSLLNWDLKFDIIFFTANTEQNSEVLHIYAMKANQGENPRCLSCKLQKSGDIIQTYYSADFYTNRLVIISSLGPGIPMHMIYEWSLINNEVHLTKLMNWETNDHLRSKLQNISLPKTEIHTVSIENNFTAKVLLQLPPNVDRSGETKYAMLVDVYGGPDSYSVIDKWNIDWGTYLSSNLSVIYTKIDGRGSGLRGENLLHSIYLKLGTGEIKDQIHVTRSLQNKLNFIDSKHTGIWGWSYGGYAAAMALANDNSSVFNCAASIAPVTDWAYYDSIYTERYMSLPILNEKGYANARLSTQFQKLRGKKYLLAHGTLDDNVHYQQAMILAKNLERYDILFKQISYTDEDHGLAGVRPHLYHSLNQFFGQCFNNEKMTNAI